MDWITGFQKAIDYVEDNLTEDLDYTDIAGRAFVSGFYFQRAFSIMCGYTLGEYIRSRRLSLAGSELSSGGCRVIDVALKYGYDSPDSFTKAFTRFHGITPSAARMPGANLKAFSRLTIKVILEGGSMLDYRIEKKQAFRVIGKSQIFNFSSEFIRDDIPAYWDRCHRDGTVDTLYGISRESADSGVVFGICFSEEPSGSKEFPYCIAARYEGGAVPDGYIVKDIEAHTWAVFRCVGAMPRAIQELWSRIYSEFLPTSGYTPAEDMDFEAYYEGDMDDAGYISEVWIPVVKK
jgi:AraC family transcriptional regulator